MSVGHIADRPASLGYWIARLERLATRYTEERLAPCELDRLTLAFLTTLLMEPLDQSAHLPAREVQDGCSPVERQLAGQKVGEDGEAPLRWSVQTDRLPRVHGSESDRVSVPLAVTLSLSLDSARGDHLNADGVR